LPSWKKRAQIDETLAELRVVDHYSRTQLEARQRTDTNSGRSGRGTDPKLALVW